MLLIIGWLCLCILPLLFATFVVSCEAAWPSMRSLRLNHGWRIPPRTPTPVCHQALGGLGARWKRIRLAKNIIPHVQWASGALFRCAGRRGMMRRKLRQDKDGHFVTAAQNHISYKVTENCTVRQSEVQGPVKTGRRLTRIRIIDGRFASIGSIPTVPFGLCRTAGQRAAEPPWLSVLRRYRCWAGSNKPFTQSTWEVIL